MVFHNLGTYRRVKPCTNRPRQLWSRFFEPASISVLAAVHGILFKVQDFLTYVLYLFAGLVTWITIGKSVMLGHSMYRANSCNIKNTDIHPIFY